MPLAVGGYFVLFVLFCEGGGGNHHLSLRKSYDEQRPQQGIACHPFARAPGLSCSAECYSQAGVAAKLWLFLSLPLNDHLEGKSPGVTGEERAMWPCCLPARKGDSIALASPLSPESAFLKSSGTAAY